MVRTWLHVGLLRPRLLPPAPGELRGRADCDSLTLRGGPTDVVNIGETDNFERRRCDLIRGVTQASGHSAGNLSRYFCLFSQWEESRPGCRLQYSFRTAFSKEEVEMWEASAIKEYVIRFAMLPWLNRQLPRAYDDVTWNALCDMIHGAEGEVVLLQLA